MCNYNSKDVRLAVDGQALVVFQGVGSPNQPQDSNHSLDIEKALPSLISESRGSLASLDVVFNQEEINEMDGFIYDKINIEQLSSENTEGEKRTCEKTILPDLLGINLSDDIKQKANEFYKRMNFPTKRKKNRKKILFYCSLQALNDLQIIMDPRDLALMVGLDKNDIQGSISYCFKKNPNKNIDSKKTPLDFLPLYFSYTGLDKESLKDVISLAKEILEKDYDLYDESPQNVSAGIIHYFMNINGAKYSANITKNIGKSNSTILSWSKKIAKIHNS